MIIPLTEEKLPADCLVYKHSTRCPISAAAGSEVESFPWKKPIYWINVIEQRELSNWVQKEFKVPHASPQLLNISGGKVVKVLSHGDINWENFSSLG